MKDDHKDIQSGLCKSMGMMFERVAKEKDIIDFSLYFFKSEVYERYLDDWTIFSQSPLYVLQLFKEEIETTKKSTYDLFIKKNTRKEEDIAYWLGFLITDWRIDYEYDPKSLTKDNLIWLYLNYETLHTQSCKYVYEVFQEERNQIFPEYH